MSKLLQEIKKTLPSFYQDSVEDVDFLQVLYASVSDLVSEMYIRVMSTVLNSSVHTATLNYSPDFRVITIRESLVSSTGSSWVCNIDFSVRDIRTLSDKVDSSGVVLEQGVHFLVHEAGQYSGLEGTPTLSTKFPVIEFLDNPYNWSDTNTSLSSNSAKTMYSTGPYILRKGLESSPVYESLVDSEVIFIKNGSTVTKHDVLIVVEEDEDEEGLEAGIYLAVSTPAPYAGNVVCSTTEAGTSTVGEFMYLEALDYEHEDTTLFLIARKPVIDRRYLHDIYGASLGLTSNLSTEDYRSNILYRMMLKTRTFNSDTLYSTIGLMLGIPYVVESDELCIDVKYLSTGAIVVETNRSTYTLTSGLSLLSSVEETSPKVRGVANPSYIGEPRFLDQYGSLSRPYTVFSSSTHDYSTNWWNGFGLYLPDYLLQGEGQARREVGTGVVFDNHIGTSPAEDARVGDYCIILGDSGRQRLAFRATKDFYKHRIILISKTNGAAPSLTEEHKSILRDSAPLDTVILFKE